MAKKENLRLMTVAMWVVLTFSVSAFARLYDGSGTEADPFIIDSAAKMNDIGNNPADWSKHFKLMADIDLSGYAGTTFNIIGEFYSTRDPRNKAFSGVFDGNGHTISNFTYSSDGIDGIGLFGFFEDANAEIRDLGLVAPDVDSGAGHHVGSLVGKNSGRITNCYVKGGSISGNYNVGGLVGYTFRGTISNCYTEGVIVAGSGAVGGLVGINPIGTINNSYSMSRVSGNEYVGALVGRNGGTIINCYATGSVEGDDHAGGLVGINSNGAISNCFASTSVLGYTRVGGLVGGNWSSTITNCYATSNVSGDEYVGGLAGVNTYYGTITNCYSEGGVSGNRYVGGLLGSNGWCHSWGGCYPGTVSYCYSTGSVKGTDGRVGGLVGYNRDSTVSASFWDTESSGQASSDGGTGKITAEMQTVSIFISAGWDFVTPIWKMCSVPDYPKLWWEQCPVIEVAVDIKPGSCPNPVNVKSSGVLPVAILGSADFDVTTIDATSVQLAGVGAIRHSFDDVATPVSDSNDCNCITEGPDGFLDLTLKFKTQRIVEAIGDVNDGDVRVLTLTGVLFDPMLFNTPIEGADCIVIRGRHKPINPADINKDGVVNAADFAIFAQNWLQSSMVDE